MTPREGHDPSLADTASRHHSMSGASRCDLGGVCYKPASDAWGQFPLRATNKHAFSSLFLQPQKVCICS